MNYDIIYLEGTIPWIGTHCLWNCLRNPNDGTHTDRSLCAIQTGFGSAVVTPSKGRDQYCIAELKRFVFEIGRTYGIIQYDPEPSLKALVSETLTELGGMSMRATPRDWKQAHGFVGKSQQNFYGQARAIRLQLQERYNVQISVQHAVYPWIVKHPQFTLSRFLTHSYGNTSYFRRWGKNYSSTVCEFGETVLFRYSGKLKDKGDTAWSTGIWLGRDTEADEHIVSTGTGIIKVRTIKRQVPSKQWDQELFLKLQATPWDPKAKQVIDTSFVLPPTLTSTGRVREPPGLERETQTVLRIYQWKRLMRLSLKRKTTWNLKRLKLKRDFHQKREFETKNELLKIKNFLKTCFRMANDSL